MIYKIKGSVSSYPSYEYQKVFEIEACTCDKLIHIHSKSIT